MNLFHQLRWKLTLSYTIVTVSAFLVILLILAGLVFAQVFVPKNDLSPEGMIDDWMNNRIRSTYPMLTQILSQSPVDKDLLNLYLSESESTISDTSLFRIGALQFSMSTLASIRMLAVDTDSTILGVFTGEAKTSASMIGKTFDPALVTGLEAPFKAAMAGETDPKQLYTMLEPNKRYVFAAPVFDASGDANDHVVGVVVILFDAVPTQGDIPTHIMKVASRSLGIFLLGVGIMGAIFGAFFAHGLTTRFKRIAATTDQWSLGDFSGSIEDSVGDEITQIVHRLNSMAEQLKTLLRRRQDMAVSEERNRLARDLHDSAKQQALAASLELGAALTLYERDPAGARRHLVEADALVDAVRKELTNLVDELRPQPINGQAFSETLRAYAVDWSQRSGIELDLHIEGGDELSSDIRECLFRILQEGLANVSRHSSARHVELCLDAAADAVQLRIRDDGCGFDTLIPHDGLGLRSMRERAEALGGSFSLESASGQGTQILVTLPKAG